MTTFTIKFDCDNAAFADGMEAEISRILRDTASKVEREYPDIEQWRTIFDLNGNDVGRWRLK